MTGTEQEMTEPANFEAGRDLWRRSCRADTLEDETAYFLDLAALADGSLDAEERARIKARIADDPIAMADVAAARALAANGIAMPSGIEPVIERAIAIVEEAPGLAAPALSTAPSESGRRLFQGIAQWGSIAAAIALASWLGFAMGSGVSLSLTGLGPAYQTSEEGFLPELLDPASGFLRDLGAGLQS